MILDISHDEIRDHRDPDLRHHRILRRSEKGFDFEMLFGPFEKELDLPTRTINFGDGQSRKMKQVGEMFINDAGFRIAVRHQTQLNGELPGMRADNANDFVFENDLFLRAPGKGAQFAFGFRHHFIAQILLGACHKESFALFDAIKPLVIRNSALKHPNAVGFNFQRARDLDFVGFRGSDVNETRQMTAMIQACVQLDRALATSDEESSHSIMVIACGLHNFRVHHRKRQL